MAGHTCHYYLTCSGKHLLIGWLHLSLLPDMQYSASPVWLATLVIIASDAVLCISCLAGHTCHYYLTYRIQHLLIGWPHLTSLPDMQYSASPDRLAILHLSLLHDMQYSASPDRLAILHLSLLPDMQYSASPDWLATLVIITQHAVFNIS